MKSAQRLSPAERNRAIERVRGMTTGIAVAGVAATVAFGYLAAVSNPGTQAVAAGVSASSTVSSSTTSSGTTSGTSTFQQGSGITFGSGPAHATSGGS